MTIRLVNLPWQHADGKRTRYYESEVMSRCFPLERLEDARGGVICELQGMEIHLFGQVKDYVLEKRTEFVPRIRKVLRAFFGAKETASGFGGTRNRSSISDSMLAFVRPAFDLESDVLENWQLYTMRVGDNVNHGIIIYGERDGLKVQRGYVSLNIVPRYNFQAWATATIKSYEKYSEADGFPRMKEVVANAEEAFLKSRAVRADFMIFENRVLPAGTKFYGAQQQSIHKKPLAGVLQTHIDLCKDHPVLYAPMLVPVRGDSMPWESGNPDPRPWMPSIYSFGESNSSPNHACTIFTTRPVDGQNAMQELEEQGYATRDIHFHHQRPDRFIPGNEMTLQVLKKMLPDLRLLASVGDIDDATFKQAHIQMITPTYRDAEGAAVPDREMNQDEAAAYIRSQEGTYKGKRNLVKLPELVGNTLALYSYVAGEAMSEYQSWNESEFLDMLDVAFATWAPSKDASATDAVNAFCEKLGCPKVSKAKYEFTTNPIFVAY